MTHQHPRDKEGNMEGYSKFQSIQGVGIRSPKPLQLKDQKENVLEPPSDPTGWAAQDHGGDSRIEKKQVDTRDIQSNQQK